VTRENADNVYGQSGHKDNQPCATTANGVCVSMTRSNSGGEYTELSLRWKSKKKGRGKRAVWPGQSGRICERNAVVETRSVLVTSRRLRCRLATTGCHRPPCSFQPADSPVLILTKDYACLLPPLHLVPLRFTRSSLSLSFFSIILPPQACPLLFSLSRPFWPSHASSVATLSLLL